MKVRVWVNVENSVGRYFWYTSYTHMFMYTRFVLLAVWRFFVEPALLHSICAAVVDSFTRCIYYMYFYIHIHISEFMYI